MFRAWGVVPFADVIWRLVLDTAKPVINRHHESPDRPSGSPAHSSAPKGPPPGSRDILYRLAVSNRLGSSLTVAPLPKTAQGQPSVITLGNLRRQRHGRETLTARLPMTRLSKSISVVIGPALDCSTSETPLVDVAAAVSTVTNLARSGCCAVIWRAAGSEAEASVPGATRIHLLRRVAFVTAASRSPPSISTSSSARIVNRQSPHPSGSPTSTQTRPSERCSQWAQSRRPPTAPPGSGSSPAAP